MDPAPNLHLAGQPTSFYSALMGSFVLVHGAWHDAWCWDRLARELTSLAHDVVTVDLPSDDPAKSFEDYAAVVAAVMPSSTEGPVILVGHSLAGLTIPLVPGTVPRVDRLVYLCALAPVPGMSFRDQIGAEERMLNPAYQAALSDVDPEGRRSWVDPELARQILYADCDDSVVAEAVAHLRPQAQTPYFAPCPLDSYPDTPSTYIACRDDQLVSPSWGRSFARDRLGAELIDLPGSHSPFLSRPAELAATLDSIAQGSARSA